MKNALLIFALLLTACKSDWREGERVMAGLPDELPPVVRTQGGVSVYASPAPTADELRLIDEGIQSTLTNALQDRPDIYAGVVNWREFRKFTRLSDYRVVLVETAQRSVSAETLGCPILLTYGGYAAGTIQGVVASPDEIKTDAAYIILPRLQNEGACVGLFRNGAKHEAEHLVLSNHPALYLAFVGETNDVHPIF